MVKLDTIEGEGQYNTVDTDKLSGAYAATKHLIELGHEKNACIESAPHGQTKLKRTEGYFKVLHDAGLSVNPDSIIKGNSSVQSGLECAKTLLSMSSDEFTAIFIQNDIVTLSACKLIKEKGLRIPEDISIVGFDDISFCKVADPAFTTVRQPNL